MTPRDINVTDKIPHELLVDKLNGKLYLVKSDLSLKEVGAIDISSINPDEIIIVGEDRPDIRKTVLWADTNEESYIPDENGFVITDDDLSAYTRRHTIERDAAYNDPMDAVGKSVRCYISTEDIPIVNTPPGLYVGATMKLEGFSKGIYYIESCEPIPGFNSRYRCTVKIITEEGILTSPYTISGLYINKTSITDIPESLVKNPMVLRMSSKSTNKYKTVFPVTTAENVLIYNTTNRTAVTLKDHMNGLLEELNEYKNKVKELEDKFEEVLSYDKLL